MRQMKQTGRHATAEEIDAMAEIRQRAAYRVARVWLERVVLHHPRPFTRGLYVSIYEAGIVFRSSFMGLARGRPTIGEALRDRDVEESVALALVDVGAFVGTVRDSHTGEMYLACNVRANALRALDMSRKQVAAMDVMAERERAVAAAVRAAAADLQEGADRVREAMRKPRLTTH